MNELNMSYNEALSEIERIVDKIENEDLDVDELSLGVKRASMLLQWCRKKLKTTEEELNTAMQILEP
jgi:exodeoxyribonuclease VII small subunit